MSLARWRRDNWEIKLMEQPDEHYSLVGGNLVITNPRQKKHAGTYVCVARNIYGTVISKEARVKFGCEHVNPAGAALQPGLTSKKISFLGFKCLACVAFFFFSSAL